MLYRKHYIVGTLFSVIALASIMCVCPLSVNGATWIEATSPSHRRSTAKPEKTRTPRVVSTEQPTRDISEIPTGEPTEVLETIVAYDDSGDFLLPDVYGNNVRLSDFQGFPVVLNFWATWCGPCIAELPLLEEYHQRLHPDVIILGINVMEDADTVLGFLETTDLTYPVLLDINGRVSEIYYVYAFPTTFFIDGNGVQRSQFIGSMDDSVLIEGLEEIGVNP